MKRTGQNKAFTIVELLTVMAVIALLIGLLVPALSMVKDYGKDIQQKSQFHSVGVGLEMFKTEFGNYPESFDNISPTTPAAVAPLTADLLHYGGAHKLAEALVGYDLLGVHPKSGFRSNGQNYFPASLPGFGGGYLNVYNTTNGIQAGTVYYEADGNANINARKGPYVDLENANAFQLRDIYGTNTAGFNPLNTVLCDVYAKSRTSGKKTGMPVLYFRANVGNNFQDVTDALTYTNDIYNLDDNFQLLSLGTAETVAKDHKLMDTTTNSEYTNFEQIILNQQVLSASNVKRPYRAGTFILISAGKDGIYGTSDDITNFSKGAE